MDAVGITWTGLKRASENPAIKYILFDLSMNGGGKTDLPIARIEPESPTHEDPLFSNGDYAPYFDDVMLDRMINEWFEEQALAPAA